MKKLFLAFLICVCCCNVFANHLKGGWIYYEYVGAGNSANTSKYRITVKQYLDCRSTGAQIDQDVYLGIFDGGSNQLTQTLIVPLASTVFVDKLNFNCIANPPEVCYRVDQYITVVDLADNSEGYVLGVQRCCRIRGIVNVPNSSDVGVTYTNKIPGMINGVSYRNNSSPLFAQKDTAIVCHDAFFTFDFSASDADGDSLSYSFITGLTGGNNTPTGTRPFPPTVPPPPYLANASLVYNAGYSGNSPMGPKVTINSKTGIISGTAPNSIGDYVVAVTVNEYRNGVLIGSTRKELHIAVADCQLTAAQLNPTYFSCDGFTFPFKNEMSTPAGSVYSWNFGDPLTGANNTSSSPTPVHTFSDTGIYTVKLKITSTGGCEDSAITKVYVYPIFSPGFITQGQCKNTQIQFLDTSKTTYGTVNAWTWDFGDPLTNADTSHLKNPVYTYTVAGNYDVTFFVSNSKGCSSTITKTIFIKDKPDFTATNDTLICSIDTLQMNVSLINTTGAGTAFWTPNYNISNQNSLAPLVSPKQPTTYYVTVTDPFGCKANDSVFVDVKPFVTIDAGKDTSICFGDSLKINTVSDALHYLWKPSTSLSSDTAKNPIASPRSTITYYVIANIGKCQSIDSIKIKVAPLSVITSTADTAICFGDIVQLNATGGSIYTWSPPFFLNNSNIPDPVAKPDKTIQYTVSIRDTLGCFKPFTATVLVQVQRVTADAGPRDTTVVLNQPLQLNATGGQFYLWTPSVGLNNPNIANPVASVTSPVDYVVRVSTPQGCFATDTITVKLYYVSPGVFLPNAFTPNKDGLNDVFKPVPVGIKSINYFRIYNRWGQLMYSSSGLNVGWDGTYKGRPQDSGVYVWLIEAVDYLDNKIIQKGIVTLIR